MRLTATFRVTVVCLCSIGVGGCVSVAGTIASSVASAAIKTAIAQAEKNKPTPEQLWHEAQVAGLEHRAVSGEIEAQYQLGTYYLILQEPRGADWICQAAIQGHAKAQLQYGHFFNEDRKLEDMYPFIGIRPDNVQALVWYSLSDQHGEPRAAHFRDSLLSGRMSPERIDRAEAVLSHWIPTSCGDITPSTVVAGTGLAPAN